MITMDNTTCYTPKTEDEIRNMTASQLLQRFNEMMAIMAQHKQMLKDVYAIDLANMDVMEIAADAVVDAQKNNADQATLDKYDIKYAEAQKKVHASLARRNALANELINISEEISYISQAAIAIDEKYADK